MPPSTDDSQRVLELCGARAPKRHMREVEGGYEMSMQGRWVRVHGLHSVLRKFFPRYTYAKAMRRVPEAERQRNLVNGRAMGSAFDGQVSRAVLLMVHGSLTLDAVADADPDSGLYLRRTISLFRFLRTHRLKPVATQVLVGDAYLRLGTAIDLVCERDDALVLIELKNIRPDYREVDCGKMLAPYTDVGDSALEQARLQLAVSAWLFASCFPGVRPVKCRGHPGRRLEQMVIVVHHDALDAYPQRPEFTDTKRKASAMRVLMPESAQRDKRRLKRARKAQPGRSVRVKRASDP